jgi:hypothetical protein
VATPNTNTSRTEWLRRSSRRSRGSNPSVETEIQLQPGDPSGPYAVAEEDWGATRRGRTATFVTFLADNNALQFATWHQTRAD